MYCISHDGRKNITGTMLLKLKYWITLSVKSHTTLTYLLETPREYSTQLLIKNGYHLKAVEEAVGLRYFLVDMNLPGN